MMRPASSGVTSPLAIASSTTTEAATASVAVFTEGRGIENRAVLPCGRYAIQTQPQRYHVALQRHLDRLAGESLVLPFQQLLDGPSDLVTSTMAAAGVAWFERLTPR